MAFDPSHDLRAMLADRAEPVTLAGGAIVSGVPGTASTQDALNGESIVAGRTRTLRFVTADVPGLQEGAVLAWAGQSWRVNVLHYLAEGYALMAYLGKP